MISRFRCKIYDNVDELSISVTRAGIGWQKNEGTSRRKRVKKGDRRGRRDNVEKLEQRKCKRDLSRRQECERGGEKKKAIKRKMEKGRGGREREREREREISD